MTIKEKIKEIEVATEELLVPEHEHDVNKLAAIKEKIKEIEVATDELLVPEHDHNVKKAATIVGDLVKDTKEAAGTMLGNDRMKKD